MNLSASYSCSPEAKLPRTATGQPGKTPQTVAWASRVRRPQDVLNHAASETRLGDDAVGPEVVIRGRDRAPPGRGRTGQGAVGDHEYVSAGLAGYDDADRVSVVVIIPPGARGMTPTTTRSRAGTASGLIRQDSSIALVQSAPGTSDRSSASSSCRPSRVPP